MKKGFTLIELLAVITILGLLLFITVPIVNNNMEKSSLKAFQSSMRELLKAAEEYNIDEGGFNCITIDNLPTFQKKDSTLTGSVCIVDGKATLDNVSNEKYVATGNLDTLLVEER